VTWQGAYTTSGREKGRAGESASRKSIQRGIAKFDTEEMRHAREAGKVYQCFRQDCCERVKKGEELRIASVIEDAGKTA